MATAEGWRPLEDGDSWRMAMQEDGDCNLKNKDRDFRIFHFFRIVGHPLKPFPPKVGINRFFPDTPLGMQYISINFLGGSFDDMKSCCQVFS